MRECPRCRRKLSGDKCQICHCQRCGVETSRAFMGLCTTCDANDIALSKSDDSKAKRTRLAELRWEIDARHGICPRCAGFGAVDSGNRYQSVSECACNDGRLKQAPPVETVNGEENMKMYRVGPVRPNDFHGCFVERQLKGKSLPHEKLVTKIRSEFGWSDKQAEVLIADLLKKRTIAMNDPDEHPQMALALDKEAA